MVLQTIQLQGKTKIVGASGGTATVTDGKLDVNATVSATITGSAIEDGVSSSIKATVKDLTNSNPLTVAVTDANGDQITSFGGGTQYTEGDTDATITGTAAMVEGAADGLVPMTQPLTDTQLRASDVKITLDGESVPVTGTFWQATQPISAASLPLPSGAATSANQTTIIGHLDGVEGLLTTIDTDTSNVSTKIDTIAGAVSGTEVQVDVLTLPNVNINPLGTIYNGTKTVPTGTAEAIASSQAISSVTVKALSTNTVSIYVGASGVTTSNGFELGASESISLDIDNLADVYVISGSASQEVRYIAI